MIFTGYYAAANKYTKYNILPVAISGKPPKGWKFPHYPKLSPGYHIWKEWHDSADPEKNVKYTSRFYNEILAQLDPKIIYNELIKISPSICLCCYEKPNDFCHRHLVADWLSKAMNIQVSEFNY